LLVDEWIAVRTVQRYKAELERRKHESTSSFGAINGPMYLNACVFEIIIAGTETTSTLIEWMLLYLLWQQEVQERMAEEVLSVTQGRAVSLDDKDRLPYCCAFIEEVCRFCPGKPR